MKTESDQTPNRFLDFLGETIGDAWQPPFRGEIYEDTPPNLQTGYAVKGQFDINTARHVIGPLQAVRHPLVRLISIQAAVQTLKSLISDLVVPYWIKHDPGDTLWLFEDDPKAKLYAESRFMPMVEAMPELASTFLGMERFEKTKTQIKFKHMNLMFAGLNLGNVQTISWRYVIIDELWMHKSDGLVRQAKDRTKQYPDTKKIILLGQGGVEDDDADTEHKQTYQHELHYACPKCRALQPYELVRLRADDFPIPRLRGTYAGLSWDTNKKTRPGDRYDPETAAATAHHRCYYCDHRIEDTPEIRRQLNDSHCHVPSSGSHTSLCLKTPPTLDFRPSMGFHWPAEASMRIPFAELVTKYLRAKNALETLAYKLPMMEFYQKDRGLPWSEDHEAGHKAIVYEPYDANAEWPEEQYRTLIVDCQRDLQKFFYSAFGVALDGEARELARGQAESFDEIAAIQTRLKIKDQFVFLDCGYEMTRVLRECVRRGHAATVKRGGRLIQTWLCWTGMKGSGQEIFQHIVKLKGGATRKDSRIYSPKKFYNVNVGTSDRQPRAPWFEWSNLHCKDLLRARRDADPGIPKLMFLPDTLPATDDWSHYKQMRSEKRSEKWTPRGKKAIWELVKETRPNHEWDKCGMLMAFMAIIGIIGAPAGEPGSEAQS